MALQYSVAVRNAKLDAVEVTIGTSAVLQMRSGAPPATCATANSGTLLAKLLLPSDWLAAAASGAKAKAGTWEDLSADAAGTLGHFRIFETGETTCHIQGTITATAGGGDMTVDNVVIAAAQAITVTSFTLTAGNA